MRIIRLNDNHFAVKDGNYLTFFSYDTEICTLENGKLYSLTNAWDFSRTTTNYLYRFLKLWSTDYITKTKSNAKSKTIHTYYMFEDDITNTDIKRFLLSFIESYGTKDVLSAGAQNDS